MGFPHGHRKTTTLVAGLRNTGMVAPLVIDGPINGDWFEAYVAQVLVPTLKPGDIEKGLLQAEGAFTKGCRENSQWALGSHRSDG